MAARTRTPDDSLRAKRIDAAALARCAELGAAFAAGLSLGVC